MEEGKRRTAHDAEALCRDGCGMSRAHAGRCVRCGSPRLVRHPQLAALAIAHVDCDAFYAAIEKRDNPNLQDRPVIVGGGGRGVVAACCYRARPYGVRSAMPMFKALRLCPDAVVIRPDIAKYRTESLRIRQLMAVLTDRIEPLAFDEAFLDLSDAQARFGAPPAALLADLSARIEAEIGVTVSVGLAANKLMAKFASDQDKPRGFHVIGAGEGAAALAPLPVRALWGVGPRTAEKLARTGYRQIGDLAAADPALLRRRYGAQGERLALYARGEDDRRVEPDRPAKSVSVETTFAQDLAAGANLAAALVTLCARLERRLREKDRRVSSVVVKLKDADFVTRTRQRALPRATDQAGTLAAAATPLLNALSRPDARYRLIGVGGSVEEAEETPDLFAPPASATQALLDRLRDQHPARK